KQFWCIGSPMSIDFMPELILSILAFTHRLWPLGEGVFSEMLPKPTRATSWPTLRIDVSQPKRTGMMGMSVTSCERMQKAKSSPPLTPAGLGVQLVIGMLRHLLLWSSVSPLESSILPAPSRQWSATVIILGWTSVAVHPADVPPPRSSL